MTPLAEEILHDIRFDPEFAEGATLTDLSSWLGVDIPHIKAAIAELRVDRLVHHVGARFFAGARSHLERRLSPEQHARARRLLADGHLQKDIAQMMGLSKQSICRMTKGVSA